MPVKLIAQRLILNSVSSVHVPHFVLPFFLAHTIVYHCPWYRDVSSLKGNLPKISVTSCLWYLSTCMFHYHLIHNV